MAAGGSLQLVHSGEAAGGDGIQLAQDAVTRPWNVEEEGDAVGPADERVVGGGAVGSDEGGVAGAHEVLEKRVVGEASLQGSVREYQRSTITVTVANAVNINVCFGHHFILEYQTERERDIWIHSMAILLYILEDLCANILVIYYLNIVFLKKFFIS